MQCTLPPHESLRGCGGCAVHGGLDAIRSVEGFARSRSTATVGEIVLRESYGLETAVKYRGQSSTNGSTPDAYLTFGDPPDDSDPDTAVFDVGRGHRFGALDFKIEIGW